MMGSRRPVVTVKAIRNALTVFAIVYVVIRGLASSPSSSNSFVLGAINPPLLSPQDQAFVVQCRTFYEQSALRRSHCDDPPASLCQNVCSSLSSNLTYYSTQLWPSSLLAACDATCATHQSQLCNGGITYMELCDATARSRLQAAVEDNVHVTIQDDRSGPSFFALLVLIFVAASDILVSVAEYKDKYLKAPPADEEAELYEASQLDSSAALLTQALRAAEQPEHLVTVAKTCFEVRCLLFDNSCDQALQIIVVFQLVSFLWNARGRTVQWLPSIIRMSTSPGQHGQTVSTTSSLPPETEGEFQQAPLPRTASSTSQGFSKAQSLAAFTQNDAAAAAKSTTRTGSREGGQQPATSVAVAATAPSVAMTTNQPPPSAFGKLTRLMGK
ncbi:hypothetical protein DYB28_014313 [Aphanomyces astaci]|uniref:Uncharacterized protein n=1 Tax=Aphanomyces astaci TaxID=112090 RepID=A0A9X8H6H3_APHAT|nr:hypothetical protein DYB28_014313 [Aphanomyces astaci]